LSDIKPLSLAVRPKLWSAAAAVRNSDRKLEEIDIRNCRFAAVDNYAYM